MYVLPDNVCMAGIADLSRGRCFLPYVIVESSYLWMKKKTYCCWRRIVGFRVSNGERFCCRVLHLEVGEEKGLGIEMKKLNFVFAVWLGVFALVCFVKFVLLW